MSTAGGDNLRDLGRQLHHALNEIPHNPTNPREVDAFRRARAIAEALDPAPEPVSPVVRRAREALAEHVRRERQGASSTKEPR